ncbi:MAG: c-type cytochrome [Chloracidobacterium sp.]|uniref:C-type cytochrome n=1 Tax=Chloracidobacterium validum TaxID=2821543 RepID=A0ABX8BBV1_9BACT|nr:cytochrome c [Chloracidobacterium validum]QUW02550.1 c-type cytochrome [Chloracidobacterium validum]
MIKPIVLSTALVGAVAAGWTASAVQKGKAAGDATNGKQLFAQTCAPCHSATSKTANVGPGLQGLFKAKKMPATNRPVSVAVVKAQIQKGGGGMPAFGSKYDAQQLNDLIAYLRTL